MRSLIAEYVLTDGPIRYVYQHPHRLDATVRYVVVATRWTDEAIIRRDLAVVDDYSRALDIASTERQRTALEDGYAVVESLYDCGCRSDGHHYQASRRVEGRR